jgi:transposase
VDRLLLSDAAWGRVAAVLSKAKSRRGAPPAVPDRLFVEAVLHRARSGCPWRDLPKEFGAWDAVYQRFRRWEQAGRWRALFARVGADLPGIELLLIDSTVVRAHAHAAGAPKKRGPRRWAAAGAAGAASSTSPRPTSARP